MFTLRQCPVCKSDDVRALERVPVATVVKGYAGNGYRIDVARLYADTPSESICLCCCPRCDLKWYADAPVGDAGFYERLQASDWYYQSDKPEYLFARDAIFPGDAVLEVGCGRGAFAEHLPSTVRYRGLEFNSAAVAKATAMGHEVEVRTIADEAADRTGAYDVVCHFQVLEHVADPEGFMRDCAKVLKPGGTMIVAVPAEDSFIGRTESGWLNMPPHHMTRWTDNALANIFNRFGINPTQVWHEPVADFHTKGHHHAVVTAGLRAVLGSEPRLVGDRACRLAVRASYLWPAIAQRLYARGLERYPEVSRGHTVCLMGTKAIDDTDRHRGADAESLVQQGGTRGP